MNKLWINCVKKLVKERSLNDPTTDGCVVECVEDKRYVDSLDVTLSNMNKDGVYGMIRGSGSCLGKGTCRFVCF